MLVPQAPLLRDTRLAGSECSVSAHAQRGCLSVSRLCRPVCRRRTRCVAPQALTADHCNWDTANSAACQQQQRSNGTGGTYERVLRYPGGVERRIRYPVVDEAESCEEACDTCYDDTWHMDHPWDVAGMPRHRANASDVAAVSGRVGEDHATRSAGDEKVASLPSSPAELLRYLTSDEYKRAQREAWDRVRDSYEVLEGCPWPLPRPLYVLASRVDGDSDHGATYTLRTRLARKQAEEELTKVLGRTRADGSPLIRVGEVVDGVVSFVTEADATRYAELLEADGHDAVSVMQLGSHELFRSVGEARGAVVLLREGCDLPQPEMLAACLRGQGGAMEDEF